MTERSPSRLDLTPGTWRLFADFDPSGADTALVLGADVSGAGDYQPQPLPAPFRTVQVDDFTVTLHGDIASGRESELKLSAEFTVHVGGNAATTVPPVSADVAGHGDDGH